MIYEVRPGQLERVLRQFKMDSKSTLSQVKRRMFFVSRTERRRREDTKNARRCRKRQQVRADDERSHAR
jgi:ribosomal protein S21